MSMRVIAWVGIALSAIYICVIVVLRKRIMLAIGVVKQASRAMTKMPLIILLPLIQAVGITIFLVPWLIYMLYLASSGDVKVESYPMTDDDQALMVQVKHEKHDTCMVHRE